MGEGRTVLVVEDDPDVRDVVSMLLDAEGFRVVTARNGAEALSVACDEPPDAILLDWMMPVMNGGDFLRAWHEHPDCPPRPVVLMSASEGCTRPEVFGVDACVPKPFDLDTLLGTLVRALEA